MTQIIPITYEALQATIRRLLPSQRGFGEDLQASNLITPIIDLTPTAEGSALPTDLARALAISSQTSFRVTNTSTSIVSTPGFHRVNGVSFLGQDAGPRNRFQITDGFSSKTIWAMEANATETPNATTLQFDFIIFLSTGDSLTCDCNSSAGIINGSSRQVADVNGNIVNPAGFSFE